jgi:hypothetical protein
VHEPRQLGIIWAIDAGALRVLGVDPGLTRCGVGVVEVTPDRRARLVQVLGNRSWANQRGIAIGNFANEMTALYVGGATAGLFTDESISWGVGPTSRLPLKFGVMFFDWDLDGRLDLLSVNGHLEEEITKVQASQKYRQPAQLFWNAGAAGFVPVGPEQAGSALFTPIVGRGCAQADLDGDGDEDLLFTQTGGAPLLLRNDRPIDRRWVRLKLVGTRANRDALGATVQLKAGGKTQWRTVTANRGYLSSSALPLTFGLGEATGMESIEVVWPGGQRQSVPAPQPDTLTEVRQAP